MTTSAAPRSLERLRADGERFMQEISREYHAAHAGFAPAAELQPIYERHRGTLGPDALALALSHFRDAPEGSEEQRSARLLADWLVEAQSARELAPLDEREIAWEGAAVVRLDDGREIPFQRTAIEIANAGDARERRAIESARGRVVAAELAPLRRERFQREREITEALGLAASYNASWELLSGVSLGGLRAECEQFLRDTQNMWDDLLPDALRRRLGIEPDEATRGDALALFRAREWDAHFSGGAMQGAITGQVREMGLDPSAGGRITFDTGEREGKRSRAFCAPVRVPDEVYLVLRPHGGQADWSTFLHELGHALHFAHMDPALPMEYRWLGDNSVTEGYAMLFDHRMADAGWLRRYTDLQGARVQEFLRTGALEELHLLRRYCAKFIYETTLYAGSVPWDALPDLYVETLTRATGFRYQAADAFVDVDPRYYAARYLRAWQLQAVIADALVEGFDEDWWRNPRAGPWLAQTLLSTGQRERADEQAERVAGRPLGFAPLVRGLEQVLA